MQLFSLLIVLLLAGLVFGFCYRLKVFPAVARVLGVLCAVLALLAFLWAQQTGAIREVSEVFAAWFCRIVQHYDQHTPFVQWLIDALQGLVQFLETLVSVLSSTLQALEFLSIILVVVGLVYFFLKH